mgnify:CR=1 FL=1
MGGGHLSGSTTAHPTPRPTRGRERRARGAVARALIANEVNDGDAVRFVPDKKGKLRLEGVPAGAPNLPDDNEVNADAKATAAVADELDGVVVPTDTEKPLKKTKAKKTKKPTEAA